MTDQSQLLPKDIYEALTTHDLANVILKRLDYAREHIASLVDPIAFPPGLSPDQTFDAVTAMARSIIFWNGVLRQKYAAERG